jgi:integrase
VRGHVRRRGKSWQAIVKITDPATGKRRQLSGTRASRDAADVLMLELLTRAGRSGEAGSTVTVDSLLTAWQKLNENAWAPSTVRNTAAIVDRYLRPALGRHKVSKLRTAEIDQHYVDLREHGGRKGGKLALGTVSKVHGTLQAALRQAVKWEWTADNPAERATLPKGDHHRITPPSPIDVLRLIDAADATDKDFGAFLHVAAASSARRGELCALRWNDIDLEVPAVVIERALSIGAEVVEKSTKTGNRRRISLDPDTVAVLRAHRLRAVERALACGNPLAVDAFVFTLEADGSRPWRPDLPTHRLRRLADKLDLPNLRLHDLRHFGASEMLAGAVELSTVAGRLGHAGGGRTTLAVYAHLLEHADENAANVMGQVLKRAK